MPLRELHIKNFALIDDMAVQFNEGFNVMTGETGAGKSIIIDAVNCVLGERADSELIRTGQETATVQGLFEGIGKNTVEKLSVAGVESGDTLIIKREISRSGKNKCYVNNSLVTLSALKAIGEFLADVHGQHEHQTLLNPENQLDLLDAFAKVSKEKAAFAERFAKLSALTAERDSLVMSESEKQRKTDMLGYQVKEIEGAGLVPGEDEEIENRRNMMINSEKAAVSVNEAHGLLLGDENTPGALAGIEEAIKRVQYLSGLDSGLKTALEELTDAAAKVKDASDSVSDLKEKLDFDPKELETLEDRRDQLIKLKKKYGGSLAEVLEFLSKIKGELRNITKNEEAIEALNIELEAVRKETAKLAEILSGKRKAAAREFEKKVVKELQDLGMAKIKFKSDISRAESDVGHIELDGKKYILTKEGVDLVRFLISPNLGEDLKPLDKIASGGELSRIMLALKVILGDSDKVATLIFDEIDTGLGGNMGSTIGEKIASVAKSHQVICITHLPQIAARASTHLNVRKEAVKGKTQVFVDKLAGEERVREVARMLGDSNKEIAVRHARELLK